MGDEHPNYEEWWNDDEADAELIKKWDKGISAYTVEHYKENIEHMKPSVDLTKLMLSHIQMYDKRWKGFKKEWFNTGKYLLHSKLNFHIRFVIKKMKDKVAADKL